MPSRLRIGVNALYMIPGGVGGTEIYLRNLLAALAEIDHRNEYFVYLNRETDDALCPRVENFTPVMTGVPASIRPLRLLYEQSGLSWRSWREGLDVLFSPGFTAPVVSRGARVTVIHDLQHKRQPQNFGFLERSAWNFAVWSSVRRARRLITVSESSKKDIVKFYDVKPERIDVIQHGVEAALVNVRASQTSRRGLLDQAKIPHEKFLLAVSTLHHHKNWDRLLAAYTRLINIGRPEHLVVTGLRGKAWDSVSERIQSPPFRDRVHLLGWQPREVVVALYQHAEALVFPSTFEGFGMPVAEAMAAGLPLACSDIPPLREIAGGAAQFFDPSSSDSISSAVAELLRDTISQEQGVVEGRRRAAALTWRRAAEQTLATLLGAVHR